MSDPADPMRIVPYDPSWPLLFAELGGRFRAALGDRALRIDHIGSTAVLGLDAKPIIDVQISVVTLEPEGAFRDPLERCGFLWRADNPDLTKRYFRERPGERRTHVHVRRSGTFDEQFALLCRDYLRSHSEAANHYGALKRSVEGLLSTDRDAYVKAKGPFLWAMMHAADEWAQQSGWEPGPSDA
jgi:GrpB-like predicted nucleotidyltransferase (UPF0157 family)